MERRAERSGFDKLNQPGFDKLNQPGFDKLNQRVLQAQPAVFRQER